MVQEIEQNIEDEFGREKLQSMIDWKSESASLAQEYKVKLY